MGKSQKMCVLAPLEICICVYGVCIFLYRRSRSSYLNIIDTGPLKMKTFKTGSTISFKEKGKHWEDETMYATMHFFYTSKI